MPAGIFVFLKKKTFEEERNELISGSFPREGESSSGLQKIREVKERDFFFNAFALWMIALYCSFVFVGEGPSPKNS
jgi:hypothetical protein